MNSPGQFCNSSCPDQMHIAKRELSAFIRAVTQLYGPEQAKVTAEDWLNESELMDSPCLLTSRHWRMVTIAASVRLANRLTRAASPVGSSHWYRDPSVLHGKGEDTVGRMKPPW